MAASYYHRPSIIVISPDDILGSAPSDRYLFSSGLFMAGVNFYGAMALGILVT
tara:strand:- start:275 stop:433 length:159 start_codon:yes stop_codon:yes gene_type:complete